MFLCEKRRNGNKYSQHSDQRPKQRSQHPQVLIWIISPERTERQHATRWDAIETVPPKERRVVGQPNIGESRAPGECIIANMAATLRQDDFSQVLTATERIPANRLQGVWQTHRPKPWAMHEDARGQFLDAFGDVNRRQFPGPEKRAVAQSAQTRRKADVCEGTICKRLLCDFANRRCPVNRSPSLGATDDTAAILVVKHARHRAIARVAFVDFKSLQVRHVAECPIVDIGHSLWYSHVRQPRPVEGAHSNRYDGIRQGGGNEISAIGQRIALDSLYPLRKTHSRESRAKAKHAVPKRQNGMAVQFPRNRQLAGGPGRDCGKRATLPIRIDATPYPRRSVLLDDIRPDETPDFGCLHLR